MNFFQGFSKGIKAYGKAARLLFSGHFSYFLLFPVFIIVVLFIAGNYAVSASGAGFPKRLSNRSWNGFPGFPG